MNQRGLTLLGFIAILSLLAIAAAVLVPNFMRARARGQLTACKSNLKNIGTGLEMYNTDWTGRYPHAMGALTPNYLKTIPQCPSAGIDPYSKSYVKESVPAAVTCSTHAVGQSKACEDRILTVMKKLEGAPEPPTQQGVLGPEFSKCPSGQPLRYNREHEFYAIGCASDAHTNVSVPAGFPKYNSAQGLVER